MVLGDWPRGEIELRSALKLMPQGAAIHQRLANVLMVRGRFDEAVSQARAAENLDPLRAGGGFAVGMVLFLKRDYPAALDQWRTVLSLHPDVPAMHGFVGMALEAKGDAPSARAEYDLLAQSDPSGADMRTAHLLAATGHASEARGRISALEAKGQDDAFTSAAIYGALGDMDRAFARLARAKREGNTWMLRLHPFLDPLRSDPRFPGLLPDAVQ